MDRVDMHKKMLLKPLNEVNFEDYGEGEKKQYWGILVDNGYQGLNKVLRTIQLKKQPRTGGVGQLRNTAQ